ncbi:hypothetical protein CC78DRAFT_532868 [Lojkania enalia]|uniref:Glyoxalase/fosfomycin resistance/dioxygenase domain-containing protein n=1 Tax=Lojkania enalia TaxID=147567 RepID=A0A9P4N8G9_9PLEO|nr:hypothetical protein CC78DRAFT_532868 [Didymosphaeria enalia]
MPPAIHNHVVNHIAISVPDCDAAIEWYGKVFGFQRIRYVKTNHLEKETNQPITPPPQFSLS